MKACTFLAAVFSCLISFSQNSATITGHVQNASTRERVPAVSVTVKGSGSGTTTDDHGNFKLSVTQSPPFVLLFSSVGFESQEVTVNGSSAEVHVDLKSTSILGTEVVVSASRVQERILESPVSIEKLNAGAIRQIAAPSFYDALPSLKGVESSVQSLTFRGVTTRGFNANGNTRFNQYVDGMDNQAPGLNFSVANIVGPSDLDVATVELLPGASSALYGAGGMNGTLLVTTKSPFEYQGLSVKIQGGVNHVNKLQQSGVGFIPDLSARYAKAFGKFAFKLSVSYLQADDWQANDSSNFDRLNLKVKSGFSHTADPGYDGVNVYGDEINTTFGASGGLLNGVTVSRTGYKEGDLVDYKTKSFKGTAALHYRITNDIEAIVQGNWGSGTTVYTGSDRYSLRNFNIGQYKVELRGKHFYLRAYTTQERSGKAYNATALGSLLNEAYNQSATYDNSGNVTGGWFAEYATVYNEARMGGFAGAPGVHGDGDAHFIARSYADRNRLQPGSTAFNQTKDVITSSYIGFGPGRNGAKFNDKTNLYQYEGMYDFTDHIKVVEVQAGGSLRHYTLNSAGTIFVDTAGTIGTNEYGGFVQVGKKLVNDRIHLIGSIRYDKNDNFDGRFTPRVAAVFTVAPQHNIRLSYQTGYRNPTNQDQYIDLPIRANTRLIGGLPAIINTYGLNTNKGFTQESVQAYAASGDPTKLQQYTFGKFKPETVDAYEIGYKGLIDNKLLIDAYYYYDNYKDFLSYLVLLQAPGGNPANLNNPNIFATYVNSPNKVIVQGAALGLDYLMNDWAISGNFSYNDITKNEGLYNSFNSPKYRYNLGIANRNVYKNIGFNVTYRWQDAFMWNSSFASGNVAAFGTIDAQVNYKMPKVKTMIKLGGSNVLNHYYQTSFGNPRVGACYYMSLTFDDLLK